MSIGDKQRLFFNLFVQWSIWAIDQGYEFTWGEAFRTDEQAEINAIGYSGRENLARLIGLIFPELAKKIRNNEKNKGIRNTLHEKRLALDLNAFKDGVYLTKTEDWKELGEYWEKLHPLCRWGGRWGDGNHLSLEHDGVK